MRTLRRAYRRRFGDHAHFNLAVVLTIVLVAWVAVLAAAHRFLGADAQVVGASRTDAGVHALRQTASLVITATPAPAAVQAALNAALPPSVRVLEAREAPARFDARRAALGKRYVY